MTNNLQETGETRECRYCLKVEPVSSFVKNGRECKSCKAARIKKWKNDNRDKMRGHSRKWKRAHREQFNESKRRHLHRMPPDKYKARGRRSNLKQLYGVTPEWYDLKLSEQEHKCAICEVPMREGRVANLHVDHSHETGHNRGLLCTLCNHAIERLETVEDWESKALAYLKKYEDEYWAEVNARYGQAPS